ncbi:MAG: DivIVA domain-containing protein, partial [Acidimicrobiia bacterium]
MASDITPDDIRRAEFRTVRRGLDPDEISGFLERVAADLDELEKERERLATKLGEYGDRDLESEFESLGREVAAVLQAAKEAADSMRERATMDAARWRSEAMTEVDAMRKEARSDAEALRGDAWTTGTELLNQSAAEARRIRGEAEQDVLSVMGEAEREAHRLTSTARREAEDVVRAAMMDSEKLGSEAKKRHDDLIEQAYRQAESAQERTRALEQRREELMLELETVRSTLSRLEGSLEERREDLDLSAESSSVRVVPSRTEPDEEIWQLGETVRIIPPTDRPGSKPTSPPPERPLPPAREVIEKPREDLFEEPEFEEAPPPQPEPTPEEVDEPGPVEARPEPKRELEPQPAQDDVGALFASLRGSPGATITVHTAARPEVDQVEAEAAEPLVTAPRNEVIEERDARLLPITNRALRGVKKAVTDAQNVALDSLRIDDTWHPESRV